MKIHFTLNGQSVDLNTDPFRRLIDVLREDFGLTGVKEGCGEGECGACNVLLDNRLAPACVLSAGVVDGREVVTIEGFAATKDFAILSEAFAEGGAIQCGYCTPGMIMAAHALLTKTPNPDESQIREALSGNLCRCTGYHLIVQSVKNAAKRNMEASSS
jgi:aerobic carbon-monoxide dehydrogenase small subunit